MKPFWKREPTENKTGANETNKNVLQMVTTAGEYYYAWNGKLKGGTALSYTMYYGGNKI